MEEFILSIKMENLHERRDSILIYSSALSDDALQEAGNQWKKKQSQEWSRRCFLYTYKSREVCHIINQMLGPETATVGHDSVIWGTQYESFRLV